MVEQESLPLLRKLAIILVFDVIQYKSVEAQKIVAYVPL